MVSSSSVGSCSRIGSRRWVLAGSIEVDAEFEIEDLFVHWSTSPSGPVLDAFLEHYDRAFVLPDDLPAPRLRAHLERFFGISVLKGRALPEVALTQIQACRNRQDYILRLPTERVSATIRSSAP